MKNLELLSKKWSGFFLTCELIVLSQFVETKATTISTYREIDKQFFHNDIQVLSYMSIDKGNECMSIYYSCTEFLIWRRFFANERTSVSQCVILSE